MALETAAPTVTIGQIQYHLVIYRHICVLADVWLAFSQRRLMFSDAGRG